MQKTNNTARGLGRGFDALIPTDFDDSLLSDDKDRIQNVLITKIKPNSNQPRTHFDEEALEQLADSIRHYGILQPLVVTRQGEDSYRIIAGERRWRAAQKASLKKVPVIIRTSEELEQLEIALVENVQRVDLSPLEQAVSIQRLHEQFSMPYDAIAQRLGKATTTVNNIARLLQLPPEAQQALHEQKISEGHARAILSLKNAPEAQQELLKLIQSHGWSVRQAEQYAITHKKGLKRPQQIAKRMETQTPVTKQLSAQLKVPVAIRRTAKGGRLELSFKTDNELNRLLKDLLKGN